MPGQRQAGIIAGRVLTVIETDNLDRAELGKVTPHGLIGGQVIEGHGLEQHDVVLFRHVDQRAQLVHVGGHGLFADDVLAVLECPPRKREVQMVGQRDIDHVDLALQHLLIVGHTPANVVLRGQPLGAFHAARCAQNGHGLEVQLGQMGQKFLYNFSGSQNTQA